MLIKNVRLVGREGLWQILCQDGLIRTIAPMSQPLLSTRELDGEEGLAMAPFIEPHIHLDTTQTAGEPSWNLSGTLFEGIERWAERKALLTHEDVKQRAIQTLKWQIANGIQFVRTHVDVSDPNLVALKAMLEVRANRTDEACALTLQRVVRAGSGGDVVCFVDNEHVEFAWKAGVRGQDVAHGAQSFAALDPVHRGD